ncbi:uncharacterized protein LOC110430516 [Sorghum bicolor]|uniref:uncharacterized protein LOC110430516 n=1 Tax=Sorghum bicolor TaxID=4558 RepID=UPI000B426A54|nr:uncharacterized protein LOC110430516 [Sorghum bicolor]|eukprot:XP_021303926.1 uncharacterized protein LOC110430516 [Sorghum bicolor]
MWRRRSLPISSPMCVLHPGASSSTSTVAMVAFPWWIHGALAFPWWIHGARHRSNNVVVSSTHQAMGPSPIPSMEAARSTPSTAPQPITKRGRGLGTGYGSELAVGEGAGGQRGWGRADPVRVESGDNSFLLVRGQIQLISSSEQETLVFVDSTTLIQVWMNRYSGYAELWGSGNYSSSPPSL